MGRRCVHLATVSIFKSQHMTRKLNNHHLHTQTDSKGWNIMNPTVFRSDNLAVDASLTKARTDHDACHVMKFLCDILIRQILAVDEVEFYFHIVINTCEVQTFPDALVGILQVILPDQPNMHFTHGVTLFVKEVMPRLHSRCFTNRNTGLAQYSCIKSLTLHADWHLIDTGHILTLHHTLKIHITERGNLHTQGIVKMSFGS